MKVSPKERLLKLMKIFQKETNEEKKMSIDDIIERLQEEYSKITSIPYIVDKKIIRSDIKKLRDSNFRIEECRVKMGKKLYYYCGEIFEMFEIRILLDAVYSAKSLTNKERESLLYKIKSLTNKPDSEIYDSKLYVPQLVVSENLHLKYYLDVIHGAIFSNKKLRFQYGNYDTNKKFNIHHNGEYYLVHPYNLVWSNDFYYLTSYDESKKKIINYRVDRMRNVNAENDDFECEVNFDINAYLNSCFNMYPGTLSTVEIRFVNKLINAVIDRFGKDVTIIDKDDKTFTIRFNGAINEGLIRWVLNWGADAVVISPRVLVNMIKEEVTKMHHIYGA